METIRITEKSSGPQEIEVTSVVPPFAGDVAREPEHVEVQERQEDSEYAKWQESGYLREMLELPMKKVKKIETVRDGGVEQEVEREVEELDTEKLMKKLSTKEKELYSSAGEHDGDVPGATIRTDEVSGKDGDFYIEKKVREILAEKPELEKDLKIVALVSDASGIRDGLVMPRRVDEDPESEADMVRVPVVSVVRVPSLDPVEKPIDVV
jgi:hypothetical protein